ncbi:MAG: hypothetical protein II304_08435 [Bacteroidales bacterium]|nr:hypothetical protein [Bacteroidales bacterium]
MSENREELIKRLREIANEEIKIENNGISAMCYCPAIPPTLTVKCEECNTKMEYDMYEFEYKCMCETIEEIRKLGYDAKIKVLCSDCLIKEIESGEYICNSNNFGNWRPLFCFYFRTNKNEKYHLAESDNSSDYDIVLKFLKDKRKWEEFDRTVLLKDRIYTIEQMTGLKLFE